LSVFGLIGEPANSDLPFQAFFYSRGLLVLSFADLRRGINDSGFGLLDGCTGI
jgi:hypothetical protein